MGYLEGSKTSRNVWRGRRGPSPSQKRTFSEDYMTQTALKSV